MRITVRSSLRATQVFRLVEELESRVLLTNTYTLASLIPMTGSSVGGTGSVPQGLIMAPNGDLYGTTVNGGSGKYGTVFKIAGSAHTLTRVASFTGANGISPRGSLVLDSGGNLFGTAVGGGANGKGVVWEVTAASLAATAGSITLLSSFAGPDGAFPTSGLIADASGNFFGYTQGVNKSLKDQAVLFKVALSGTVSTLSTVATFPTNAQPAGGLTLDAAGNIFGVTAKGGTKQLGTVFEVTTTSSTIVTLVSFTGTNGSTPNGTLVMDSGGTLYGTTMLGGASGSGTLFKIAGTANTLTTLKSFSGSNGSRPLGSLILDSGGNLFGVTASGGTTGGGTLFEWSPSGTTSTLTTLFTFKAPVSGRVGSSTGNTPSGPLILNASGHFFGTAYHGGPKNLGGVFELAPPP